MITNAILKVMDNKLFSVKLKTWLNASGPRTIGSLNNVFMGKSFAVAILILMAVPALPAPTGGITHLFEIVSMVLAGEMILGSKNIWLPKRWQKLQLGELTQKQALPKLISLIGWFEKRFKSENKNFFETAITPRLLGVVLLSLIIAAFLAPPFSGLDTLPALGAVVVCLAIILDNFVLMLIGIAIGTLGLALVLALGKIIFDFLF